MYFKKFYHTLKEDEILASVRTEGFNPIKIVDDPGYEYRPHTHPETKLLVFLRGSMLVRILGEEYICGPGDKVIIPGDVEHSATVGEHGCEFLWSEKML